MKSKRFLCLLLVLLMVFSLTPSETRAETTVYFTAVNDQLLPDLSDETMPFWSGGRLYVPSTVITGTDLGLFYSRSRDKSTAVVYRQGSALTFNFAAGTVADQNDRQYSGPAIVRSDVVFLPLDLLTQFFSLDYSYTRVTYGYLVRVKSDTVVLSDAKFIDAAAMSMEQRYNEYMKTHSESNDPGNTPDQNTDGDRDLVCLALRVTDEESANTLLDTLVSDNATATFLFSEEQLSSLGDLLRRVVISGNAAALRIDASGGSSRTVSAIERANNALWAACNEKARLVALYGASDKTLRAVRAAGYCPIDFRPGLQRRSSHRGAGRHSHRASGPLRRVHRLPRQLTPTVQENWSALLARLRSSSRLDHGAQRARGHKGRVTVLTELFRKTRTVLRIIVIPMTITEERHTLV